ncbi:hypothetical protein PoB_001665900 [Plakobranchus ocellatus]|uniref:Uncharacterized protein n=1 Tax=Plakobranchus ocellatus TaxID=259542 RepID=A0AAV3Z6Z3_9GAST|nr:hypothetical protein PoB_001665900 [Plakobranchus ocellatus]
MAIPGFMLGVYCGSSHYDAGICVSIFGLLGCRRPWVKSSLTASTGASVFNIVVSVGQPSPQPSHGNKEHVRCAIVAGRTSNITLRSGDQSTIYCTLLSGDINYKA